MAEALWVMLPTEILSTPVAAIDFTVLRLTFPDASVLWYFLAIFTPFFKFFKLILSNKTVLNLRPIISLSCFKLSTSTVIFFPFLFLIAFKTISLILELTIWLSLIKNSSLKLNLWFVPPPSVTPYFWITLKFGMVLRVQQILHFFPTNFTNWFVWVAIPEIWDKKFSATLSAISIFFASPSTVAITDFF